MSGVVSGIGNFVSNIGKAVSGLFKSPSTPTPLPAPTAPTAANSYEAMDAAAQQQAASMARGRTSTMLTGSQGEDEDNLKTSKTLLGN